MKFLIICVLLLWPFFASAQDPSAYDHVIAKNEITCGVMAWAPYAVLDPNTKQWSGFTVQLMRKLFATLDLKVTFKEVVPGNQVQDLNSGRVDAICGDGPWTLSAGKFVEYSDPLYATLVYPYVRQDDNRFKTKSDLNNNTVHFTSIDGDLSADLVQRLFPQAKLSSMPATTDVAQLFLNVSTKKADVAIGEPGSFAAFNKNNLNQLKPLFKDKPLGKYKGIISVKKGDSKLLGLVNQAVDNGLSFGITGEAIDAFDPDHTRLMRVRDRYSF